MKTTTIYRQTLTITTDDNGAQHISRTHTADTLTEYYFAELSPEAQRRAICDAIEEEQEDYYSGNPCQTYFAEHDIIKAARDLEKSQPVDIAQDQGCSWYGTACGTWWYHAADWQTVTEQQHTGIVYSMDICDTWNAYAARIIALQEAHEEATERAYIHDENADNAADNGNDAIAAKEYERSAIYERIAERIEDAAEELTEEAARAVGNVVDGLIEAERDYYQSPEFWTEWLDDGETRFTRDGIRI